jgi:hypothetical protein
MVVIGRLSLNTGHTAYGMSLLYLQPFVDIDLEFTNEPVPILQYREG